jgi:penicillin-binding protein 2B
LTAIQQAQIAEHQEELAGIKVGITWQRDYQDTALRSIIGTVTSEKVGLPAEMLDEYLKKGYQRNDRVGTSYVEKGYEDDLKGTHTVTEITVNKSGDIADEKTTQVGKKGSDLKLTIDLDFQTKVEAILNNAFNQGLADGNFNLSSGIFAVALDAKTGAVLSMAGYVHDPETGETTKNALSTIQNTYVPGSTIKAATLTNGWETGVISGNQTLNDQAINLKGSAPKTSLFNKSGVAIPISAVQALEFSSNTYMIQIALKMLGKSYEPNMEVPIGHLKDAFEKARAGYGQYGLGVSTGLDIPGESTGFIPAYGTQSVTAAAFLDESFGQFDNYTTMQLAQYIATIANNGNRISPHIVEGVYDSSTANPLEKITRDVQGKLMNKVDLPSGDMSLIQQGLYQVVNGTSPYTTGRSLAQGLNLTASAKTGTAETFYVHPDKSTTATVSRNMVAYAPSNDPQIAVAVVIPNITIPANGSIPNYHANVTRDILNLYKDMYMK